MGCQVEHSLEEGNLGAQERVSGRLVYNIPPPDAVLLGCEHRGDKVGSLEVAFRGCGHKEATASSEGSIFKAERGYL